MEINDAIKALNCSEVATEISSAYLIIHQYYVTRIVHFVYKHSSLSNDAEDIANDVLLRFFMNIRQKGLQITDETEVARYLFAIARHVIFENLRQRRRYESITLSLDAEDSEGRWEQLPATIVDTIDEMEDIEQMLAQLHPRDRELLRRRFFQDMSISEIAEADGISQNATSVRITRAIKSLRTIAKQDRNTLNRHSSHE